MSKFKVLDGSENYVCSVIRLPVKQKVEGLDNLVRVEVFGNSCLISKDSEEGLYLFFPTESQISSDFLHYNNLYRHTNLNFDTTKKGFFEDTGRVRTVRFKGVISTGFVIPVDSMNLLFDEVELRDGDEFNEYEGELVCKKYKKISTYSEPNDKISKAQRHIQKFNKLINNQFRFHKNTAPLAKNLEKINPNDIITITDKWHGTSAVFANVIIKRKLNWREKFVKWLGFNIVEKEYGNLYSSRTVIKNQYINPTQSSGYFGEDIWGAVNEEIKDKIEEGITLYGEIVGFTQSGKAIQSKYDYGCESRIAEALYSDINFLNQHKFVVYRITYTSPIGNVIEFNWQQIMDYCEKYQLTTVPLLYYGYAKHLFPLNEQNHWNENFYKALSDNYLEKKCPYCVNDVPAEGIVLRVEKKDYVAFKLKSKLFLLKETQANDEGQSNIEEES